MVITSLFISIATAALLVHGNLQVGKFFLFQAIDPIEKEIACLDCKMFLSPFLVEHIHTVIQTYTQDVLILIILIVEALACLQVVKRLDVEAYYLWMRFSNRSYVPSGKHLVSCSLCYHQKQVTGYPCNGVIPETQLT